MEQHVATRVTLSTQKNWVSLVQVKSSQFLTLFIPRQQKLKPTHPACHCASPWPEHHKDILLLASRTTAIHGEVSVTEIQVHQELG